MIAALRAAWRRPWVRRGLFLLFLVAVTALLVRYARAVDWREVGRTLADYRAGTLALAIAAAASSFLLYACYDLVGRAWVGHRLPVWRTMAIAAVSYVFNLNLGAAVGGAGFRLRLYTRHGLDPGQVARVLALSVTTNWLGYVLVAGAVFVSGRVELPPDWRLSTTALRAVGLVLLLVPVAYVVLCALRGGREFSVRGHRFELPGVRTAVLQLVLAGLNWLAISLVLYALMPRGVAYPELLGVFLLAAIAGAIAHIPAGIGALEAVFIALLGHRASESSLLAALLAYRAIYYIGPLLIAVAAYAALEWRPRRSRISARAPRERREKPRARRTVRSAHR